MTKSSDRLLIGNVLKSIRIKKDIPIKQIAKKMNVSESMISQLETGKNNFSKDKIIVYTNICGCSFNFNINRRDIIEKLIDVYKIYSELKIEKFNNAISNLKKIPDIAFSSARFEYYLILYMDNIVNKNISNVEFIEKMIEIGINSFTNNELAIYYDMHGLKYIYSKNSIKAVKFLEKSISFNSNSLMNNYHHCTIFLNLGYYNLAQIFINKSLKIALEDVMIERLFHLLLNQASLYINTLQYQEADRINLKLLEESYVRNDLFLRYCVLSNLTLSSLLKKDFNDGFVYIGMIDQKYLNDDYDLILYQIMLYFFSNDYISTKNHIRKALGNTSISSYYKNFFQGIKYLMDNKFIKAIDRIERCYDLALSDGEVDRAMLVLKLLNELYLDHGLQNKLKKVKELQENFYKMSYANQIIEDIGLKLN